MERYKILNYEIDSQIHGSIDSSYFELPADKRRALLAAAVLAALEQSGGIRTEEMEIEDDLT